MDGQDVQDEERADLRFEISNLLILHILPIHVNCSVGRAGTSPAPTVLTGVEVLKFTATFVSGEDDCC
jgi:hypothetical protein